MRQLRSSATTPLNRGSGQAASCSGSSGTAASPSTRRGCGACSACMRGFPTDIDPARPRSLRHRLATRSPAQRRDPGFPAKVLSDHGIRAYVTSIENRDRIPLVPPVRPATGRPLLLRPTRRHGRCSTSTACSGLSARRTSVFSPRVTSSRPRNTSCTWKNTSRRDITSVGSAQRRRARLLSFDPPQPHLPTRRAASSTWTVSSPRSSASAGLTRGPRSTTRFAITAASSTARLRDEVISCVAEAMLEALEDIGREHKEAGARFGCCIQLCGGARHFMDWSREIQSFPVPIPHLPQDEYPVWIRYPPRPLRVHLRA